MASEMESAGEEFQVIGKRFVSWNAFHAQLTACVTTMNRFSNGQLQFETAWVGKDLRECPVVRVYNSFPNFR